MSEATEMLQAYKDAEKKVLSGQSYMISTGAGSRQLTRANLAEIREGINYWQRKVNAEQAASKGGSSNYAVADFR